MTCSLVALGVFVLLPAPLPVQEDERVATFPEYHLTLQLPEFEQLATGKPDAQEKGNWRAKVGEARVWISFVVMPAEKYGYYEPGDVADLMVHNRRKHDDAFRAEDVSFPAGKYGYAPFAAYFEGDTHSDDGEVNGRHLALCGLFENDGYVIEVDFRPAPSDDDLAPIRDFLLNGVSYDGPERDPEWTLEEIQARWVRDAPDDLHEDFVKGLKKKSTAKDYFTRTDHYLVLTNSSSGKLFAKQLEKNYKTIAGTFPFTEVEGRRLMPIFLFRTRENYIEFCMKAAGETREEAEASGGHAWKDYYTTWYEAAGDPVHIHECTHQIFGNRLRLDGGGSWFQEGVAEYIETSENDRNEVARLVKKGQHTPLRDFVQLRSLLHSSEDDVRGGSKASDHYKQAALFIEFLAESKFAREKFEEFLYTVGNLPRNVDLIDASFQDLYGVSIDELDAEWQEYCKKR